MHEALQLIDLGVRNGKAHTMDISARLTRYPDAFDPARGADVARAFASASPETSRLITGTAGSSPYLARLLERETEWIAQALCAPEEALEAELNAIAELTLEILPEGLRQAKRRIALLVALMDLGGVWPLEKVTGSLTHFADAALQRGIETLVAQEIARGKMPAAPESAVRGAGMVAMAMGKMGAYELNYSSDIDLICLFDESQFGRDDYLDARAGFIRVTRRLAGLLSDITSGGYVFRTDLRLRPDASVTPVCMPMAAAEAYYESEGRTWERAAYIKARPAAGDLAAGEGFLNILRPFVWRRHLDFAAIQDAHDMRLKIRDHKGLHGPLNLTGHNMKLGRGGIREIEFFTQTRQLIAGGRDPSLRLRGTVEGLEALVAAGWVPAQKAERLIENYRFHREVEHRLQMLGDAQTHDLPVTEEGFARLAAFMGRDVAGLKAELRLRLEEVHSLTEDFFAPSASLPQAQDSFGQEVTARWPSYPALKSSRAVEIFRRLRPMILARLKEAAKPEEALAEFDRFLSGLPSGVQLFSLFEANPQLVHLLVDICATAPGLAQYLSRNAQVLDAVIGGSFFAPWPASEVLLQEAKEQIAQAQDYEVKLDALRRWMKEWHFRIGVHFLRGLIDAKEAGAEYGALAEAVVQSVWPVVEAEFARKYGRVPGARVAVIGMGSLGAGRLTGQSDLDLILIYDAPSDAISDGKRALAASLYFARLTQALITALSAPMSEGRLYEVDMRLRPSGNKGPVATAWGAFQSYQSNEAWTWEHLALTRARVLAGDATLGAEVEAFRFALIAEPKEGAMIRKDVADMRNRIAAAKPVSSRWEAKIGAGRLQDIELFAQSLALLAGSSARQTGAQIEAGVAAGILSAEAGQALCHSEALYWRLQSATRLLTAGTLTAEALGEGAKRFILQATGHESGEALVQALEMAAAAATQVIEAQLNA